MVSTPSRILRLLAGLTIAAVGVGVDPFDTVDLAPTVAAQSDGNGLEESSTTTFRIDPESGTVRVTIEMFLRNVTPDRRNGNVINQTFFSGYGVVVPAGAENIVATQNGSTLTGESDVGDADAPFFLYRFDLARNIFNGQSATIVITYDHTGQPPRSELLWRANSAYASFLAYGPGDSGSITLQVVLPVGYDIDDFSDTEGFEVSGPNEFGALTYTRSGLSEDFAALFSLSNDDLLTSTPLDVPGADLVLRSWPDDPEWVEFATEAVESGVPELEELIGTPWPLDDAFDIRQTVEPSFSGYAGWFDTRASEIAVGEALDANTLYHELTHAWFNGTLFSSRWLSEGMAELYSAEMVERDGDPRPEPETPPAAGSEGRQPLAQWDNFSTEDETEEYGYNASFFVMDAVADDIGLESMGDVLAAAREGRIVYPPNGPVGIGSTDPTEVRASDTVDWRRMLDVFEFVGGSEAADSLFRSYVIAESDLDELDERAAAIDTYNTLAADAAPWPVPIGIRERMDLWAFRRASTLSEEAGATLDLRRAVDDLAEDTGLEPTASVMRQAADDFGAAKSGFAIVDTALSDEIAAGEQLRSLQATIETKSELVGAVPPALSTLDDIDGFASAQPRAEDQIGALDTLAAAIDANDEPRSFIENLGLRGTDLDADLDAVRRAIEAGDNGAARSGAAEIERALDEADSVGTQRLLIAAAVALGVVAVAIASLLLRRRSKRRAASGSGVVVDELGDGNVDLDEDALAGAGLGSMDDIGDVSLTDPGETSGTTGVIERSTVLSDVGDPVFELDEDIGAVIDADPVTGAEVLIDPDSHDEHER